MDFIDNILIIFLVAICICPFVFIVLGIFFIRSKPRSMCSFSLFIIGSVLISSFVAVWLSGGNKELGALFSISFVYADWKLYQYILYFNSHRLIPYSRSFIRQIEDTTLPSCEKYIISDIKERYLAKKPDADNIQKESELLVYNAALSLIHSTKFHSVVSGGMLPEGQQLLNICRRCLHHYVDKKYISQELFLACFESLHELEYHDFIESPQIY